MKGLEYAFEYQTLSFEIWALSYASVPVNFIVPQNVFFFFKYFVQHLLASQDALEVMRVTD